MSESVVIIDPENSDSVEALRRSIAAQPMTQNVSFEAIQEALRMYPRVPEVRPTDAERRLIEFEFVLRCAWEGVMLPIPCTHCNGMSRHYSYCPHEQS